MPKENNFVRDIVQKRNMEKEKEKNGLITVLFFFFPGFVSSGFSENKGL